ncbi:hypothetical protein R1A27_18375 [Methylobacterium sp. NMS12]|uniref:hypothetical protein n=1 Tax=Methylobacterium sp. NMS12 TaxID=3079766 RepID=UPI003F88586B
MSLIVVQSQEDHEQADAVLRGVAEGLSRLFSVPDHPPGVRDLLDSERRKRAPTLGRSPSAARGAAGATGFPEPGR